MMRLLTRWSRPPMYNVSVGTGSSFMPQMPWIVGHARCGSDSQGVTRKRRPDAREWEAATLPAHPHCTQIS